MPGYGDLSMYIAIDQYNQTYQIKRHPRKELLEQLAASRADKMYVEALSGDVKHIGYVIRGLWLHVFKLDDAFPTEVQRHLQARERDVA
jgi:hypothetical protein